MVHPSDRAHDGCEVRTNIPHAIGSEDLAAEDGTAEPHPASVTCVRGSASSSAMTTPKTMLGATKARIFGQGPRGEVISDRRVPPMNTGRGRGGLEI